MKEEKHWKRKPSSGLSAQRIYFHLRTAIEAEILFAARVTQVRFLKRLSGKTPLEQNSSGKKIEAESAVPILVYLCIVIMVHKYRQSAKRIRSNKNILFEVFPLTAGIAGSGKTKPFEKRRSRYKETAENKAEAYRVYVEHLFSACDAVDARIFSKGEMDEETGLYYYGARYLDPKYSRWLSGDPALSDYIPKAPIDDEAKKHNEKLPGMGGVFNVVNLHLYHYAGNNPVKYTDPDGKIVIAPAVVWGINATLFGYGVVASRNDEIGFAARHPIIAVQLGLPKDGGRHGINSAASNFAINSGLSKFAFTGASQDLGSKKGAYRHAVWQAIICSKFGENIATEVGNSHDPITPGKQSSYTSLDDADTYCDQMNNIIGRTLGKDSNLSNKELALKALDIFHDAGLYTVSQNKDGSYSVGITRINDSEYNTAYSEILKRNNQGLLE